MFTTERLQEKQHGSLVTPGKLVAPECRRLSLAEFNDILILKECVKP